MRRFLESIWDSCVGAFTMILVLVIGGALAAIAFVGYFIPKREKERREQEQKEADARAAAIKAGIQQAHDARAADTQAAIAVIEQQAADARSADSVDTANKFIIDGMRKQ